MKPTYYILEDGNLNPATGIPEQRVLKKFKNKNDAMAYYNDPKISMTGSYRLVYKDADGNSHDYDERRREWT